MRKLYALLIYLLTPFLIFRLWWKGRSMPAYRGRIAERFMLDKVSHGPIDFWIHAVSLGEVIAVTPLIEALLATNARLLITSMTPTGLERTQRVFGERVLCRYVPYDLSWVVKRFYKTMRPRVAVFVETELWPNLIHYAKKAKVPLYLVNARLSERSYQQYARARRLFQPLLAQFTAILAQSEDDAKRFQALGTPDAVLSVLGNMKFDMHIPAGDASAFSTLKEQWGKERPVVMLASTHDNEEGLFLERLRVLQPKLKGMVLLIAPRHPERFQAVYRLSQQMGFNTGLRSQAHTIVPQNEVVVLDCLGELLAFYQLSDYAIVGGSFVPVGGHNVLEPIAMQVPVFSGPFVFNFKTICRDLLAEKALALVKDMDELISTLIHLHDNEGLRKTQIRNATTVLEKNKGVITRYVDALNKALIV